jgi:TM2 domain-containing membrane protein YozV
MPRCINCGQRIGGGSGTLLLTENPEESTVHAPWWQSSPGSLVPPPPQVKEEAARAEAARREAERIAEEQRQYEERLRQRAEVARAKAEHEQQHRKDTPHGNVRGTTLSNCWRCGAPMGEAGAVFSFCLRCGADSRENPRFTDAAPTAQEHQNKTEPQVRVRVHTTQQQTGQQQRHTANPATAALLSFFIPGVGQMMNGQRGKGILLLLAWIVFHFVVGVPWFLQIVAQVLAAMDAYRIAERRRAGKPVREEEWDLG